MIFVVELPERGDARAWFAFDADDLASKQVSMASSGGLSITYWNETQAVAAFEGGDPRIAGKAHWRARRALYEQLVSLDVLADDC